MKEKSFKPIWVTYWIQLIPAVYGFTVLSLFTFDLIITDVFKVPFASPQTSPIRDGYNAVHRALLSGYEVTNTVRLYTCVFLCFIGAVVIAILARNILSKRIIAFLFLPYILFVLAFATAVLNYEIICCLIYLASDLCLLTVQIYLPIKLKKL